MIFLFPNYMYLRVLEFEQSIKLRVTLYISKNFEFARKPICEYSQKLSSHEHFRIYGNKVSADPRNQSLSRGCL